MSNLRRKNGAETSPCILSQVKYALALKTSKPLNNKKCSAEYWNETVILVAEKNSIKFNEYQSLLK